MVGLLLIALGTGGIKPCVAAFGGDQFTDEQERQRSTFFSIFYLSINAGSLLSTVITPILRAQECGIHSQQKCYPLAFGVPAALMVVALIVFIVGSGMYSKVPPQGNIMVKVCSCIGFAIKNRYRHRSSQHPKREHWMDWAEDKYDKLLIAQVKMVLKVLFLYIPLPMFWALFDQQGSRWTLQATTMDGDFGLLIIQPDQMQTVNPILILALVPLMDSLIYPLIAKCKLNFSPLKRMTVGMFLAALAFFAAAIVQLQIDQTLPTFPSGAETQAKFINMVGRPVSVNADGANFTLEPFKASEEYVTLPSTFKLLLGSPENAYNINFTERSRNTLVIADNETAPTLLEFKDLTTKPDEGENAIRVFNGLGFELDIMVGSKSLENTTALNMSNYALVPHGSATVLIKGNAGETCTYKQELGFGSSYTLLIPSDFTFGADCAKSIVQVMDIKPNTIHMAWQIPQYFLMTAGEVVFSVTGLEFSYSQAPSNMKSVLQAGWLLTVAVGNIVVLIIAEAATLPDQWAEYVLFASLLVVVCVIFAIMGHFYTYIEPAKIEAQFAQMEPEDKDKNKKIMEMTRKDSRCSDSSSDEDEYKRTKL